MIFHLSIAADDPARVAAVLAELWGGEHHPFPPIGTGSRIVFAGDMRNSAIEVYPRGLELHPSEGDADVQGRINAAAGRMTATHCAIATTLKQAEVMRVAEREGWIAKYRKRGGAFGVVELWLENATLVEVLTSDMQAEYLDTMTIEGWGRMVAAMA